MAERGGGEPVWTAALKELQAMREAIIEKENGGDKPTKLSSRGGGGGVEAEEDESVEESEESGGEEREGSAAADVGELADTRVEAPEGVVDAVEGVPSPQENAGSGVLEDDGVDAVKSDVH
jgi:hypothetical protein